MHTLEKEKGCLTGSGNPRQPLIMQHDKRKHDAMTARINSTTRMQRAIEQSPIPEMTADLVAGHITPVTAIKESQMRYRQARLNESDAKSCMTHACRAYAQSVGTVLVVTDQEGSIIFGVLDHPRHEPDDPRMIPTLRALGRTIDRDHIANVIASRSQSDHRETVECPIYVMPAYAYERHHGKMVEAYGTYYTSFSIPAWTPTASHPA